MSTASHGRARQDVVRLVHRGAGVDRFARDVARIVRRVVPFDGTCLLTLDPATMLPTGEVVENGLDPAVLPRLTEIEQREADFNTFTELARRGRRSASLSDATAGDLERSVRQRELRRPCGFDDELRVLCTDSTGTWGALTLLRETGRPRFTRSEVRFLGSISGLLAEGLRRATLLGAVTPADDRETGVIVLAPDNSVHLANAGAEFWLEQLGGQDTAGALPHVVLAVAARARHVADDDPHRCPPAGDRVAQARVRTSDGRWVNVRGSNLGHGAGSPVAVLLEHARPPELAPLIADAYALTDRERRVTELVAKGHSTQEIGQRLHVSAYTVQDHLKSIFDKTATSSRGDLVARLFFDHYAPRLTSAPPD